MKPAILIAFAAILAAPLLWAAPAPWYQWRSKVDGATLCSQTLLGAGWVKFAGPYRDAHCAIRMPAK